MKVLLIFSTVCVCFGSSYKFDNEKLNMANATEKYRMLQAHIMLLMFPRGVGVECRFEEERFQTGPNEPVVVHASL